MPITAGLLDFVYFENLSLSLSLAGLAVGRKGERVGMGERGGSTHAGVLLNALQDVLGRDQEVDEVAQAVAAVRPLHLVQHLAQHGGGGGLERREERRQGVLDAAIQGFRVLRGTQRRARVSPVTPPEHVARKTQAASRKQNGRSRRRCSNWQEGPGAEPGPPE